MMTRSAKAHRLAAAPAKRSRKIPVQACLSAAVPRRYV